MAHRKHHRGMKHHSGSGSSRTLKQRQLQIRKLLKKKGWFNWELPFEGVLK